MFLLVKLLPARARPCHEHVVGLTIRGRGRMARALQNTGRLEVLDRRIRTYDLQ